jgi:triphosphoribosyl-dephospho-CoA synthase
MIDPAGLEAAFVTACRGELQALKPGNVHIHAPGHRMTVEDFEVSALVAAGPLCRLDSSIGARIEAAVRATWDAVAMNTNLGIILLAAPLIAAAERDCASAPFQSNLAALLDQLTIEDAAAAFRGIALANPAGLGAVPDQDVAQPPTVTLRQAMDMAASRDLIARQYVTAYDDVWRIGLAALNWARERGWPEEWAVTTCYMAFLASFPDSHIVRKHGESVAREVLEKARTLLQRLLVSAKPSDLVTELQAFDNALKLGNINPGSCADLTVATLLASEITAMILPPG